MTASLITTVNSNVPKLVALDPSKVRTTLADVISKAEDIEAAENADVIVALSDLKMTGDGNIVAPGVGGEHALNSWSRSQLASLVGLKWERWFEGTDGTTRASEINPRLARSNTSVKIRTTRKLATDVLADGTVKAIVSPTFVALHDSAVAREIAVGLGMSPSDLKVLRMDVTERTTSYVVAVGEPFHAGSEVGHLWGGLLTRNSNVGFSTLSVTLNLTRLACKNGMVTPLGDANIVRRRHRGSVTNFADALHRGLQSIHERVLGSVPVLAASANVRVTDIEGEVRRFLGSSKLPVRLLAPVMAAYSAEPHSSVWGISQAVTLASQGLSPEERFDLDRAAGEYVRHAVSN